MADRASLEKLARFRERDDLDDVLAATERRVDRRRHLRLATVPLIVVAVLVGGWFTLTSPSGRTIPQVASGPVPDGAPCPEGSDMIDRRTLAAVAAGTALITGCTSNGSAEEPPTPSAADWPSRMTLEITGDLDDTAELIGSTQGMIHSPRDMADSMVEAWERGDFSELPALSTVRFTPLFVDGEPIESANGEQHLVTLSWRDWADHHDLNRVSLILKIADYTVVPRADACQLSVTAIDTLLLEGTIDCTDLRGVRGGSDQRPEFDLHAEFTYEVPICVLPDNPSGSVQDPADCQPLDR